MSKAIATKAQHDEDSETNRFKIETMIKNQIAQSDATGSTMRDALNSGLEVTRPLQPKATKEVNA